MCGCPDRMRLHRDELCCRESERIPPDRFDFLLRMRHKKDSARVGQVAQQHFMVRMRAAKVIDDEDGWDQSPARRGAGRSFRSDRSAPGGAAGTSRSRQSPRVYRFVSRWVACGDETPELRFVVRAIPSLPHPLTDSPPAFVSPNGGAAPASVSSPPDGQNQGAVECERILASSGRCMAPSARRWRSRSTPLSQTNSRLLFRLSAPQSAKGTISRRCNWAIFDNLWSDLSKRVPYPRRRY